MTENYIDHFLNHVLPELRIDGLSYADAAENALDALADNQFTAALRGLARYALGRDH